LDTLGKQFFERKINFIFETGGDHWKIIMKYQIGTIDITVATKEKYEAWVRELEKTPQPLPNESDEFSIKYNGKQMSHLACRQIVCRETVYAILHVKYMLTMLCIV